VLYEVMKPPLQAAPNAITSRIKINVGAGPAERRLPQDGRIQAEDGARQGGWTFRVSGAGPDAVRRDGVLRLLDKGPTDST